MAYVTLSINDVVEALNAAELARYRAIGTGCDPLPGIITRVTNRVRGFVRKQNTLEAGGIPQELVDVALDIIIYRLAKGMSPDAAKSRKPARDDAEETLKDVAKGDFRVAEPATPTSEKTSAPSPSFGSGASEFAPRGNQDGL